MCSEEQFFGKWSCYNMHDISWEDISNQYLFQMHIHNILAEEYAKEGLVYGGRTYYARYNQKNL